jgi:hypothetical protein
MSRINERRYQVIVNDRNVFVRNRRFFIHSIHSTSFISLLIYYISFVLRAMANFYKGGAAEA